MAFKKIDHIAIAVPEFDQAISIYKNFLGKDPEHVEEIEDQQVKAAFFGVGETNLELLFPTSDESPIATFLEKRKGKGGLHHICLEVSDLEKHIEELKKQGVRFINETPKMGAHSKKIVFIHPKSTGGVLIELSERKEI